MTPQEKAKELVDKYYNFGDQEFDYSKDFALIAVEEVMVYLDQIMLPNPFKQYLIEVKHEIEKL